MIEQAQIIAMNAEIAELEFTVRLLVGTSSFLFFSCSYLLWRIRQVQKMTATGFAAISDSLKKVSEYAKEEER